MLVMGGVLLGHGLGRRGARLGPCGGGGGRGLVGLRTMLVGAAISAARMRGGLSRARISRTSSACNSAVGASSASA